MILAVACALTTSACSGPGTADPASDVGASELTSQSRAKPAAPEPLPAGSTFDYQIGGAYPPIPGVDIVSRDRADPPVREKYNICYVNAFQTQPGESRIWSGDNADLILRDSQGRKVPDEVWGEFLLDISSGTKRTRIARIVNGWIDECAAEGFDAVEPDNLDSWTRSGEGRKQLISMSDAVAFSRLLVAHAHKQGLATAQKNANELEHAGKEDIGFDFVLAEECGNTGECSDYANVYGDQLVDVEYTDNPRTAYRTACANIGENASVILRDRLITTPENAAYRYERCGSTGD